MMIEFLMRNRMPATELTQKVEYCTIRSMSRVCYIEKNNLPGTAGNERRIDLYYHGVTNF